MADGEAAAKPEIVIIRRKPADDGAAVKGGAWKIAYADFVTAMMAFFLVMWLINASNEATRAQVASYFNPIKLTDTSTGEKGLTDPKAAARKRKEGKSAPADSAGSEASARDREEELLADPEQALDKILVEEQLRERKVAEAGSHGAGNALPGAGAAGIGDPFDPKSWEALQNAPEAQSHPAGQPGEDNPAAAKPVPPALPAAASKAEAKTEAAAAKDDSRLPRQDAVPALRPDDAVVPAFGSGQSRSLAADLKRKIDQRLGSEAAGLGAALEIRAVDDGLLINLTDKREVAMFRSGSAEPDAGTIALIGAIAAALKDEAGDIVVRGHTDSTPYLTRKYDNWQLSTARAHMTQYMLVRGGLDEGRLRRVEGLADREPINRQDPSAPENRRIEILLMSPK